MTFSKGDNITCGSCNNQIAVKSSFSDLIICAACGNVITTSARASLLKVLPIPEDMCVLQLGCRGKLGGRQEFEVIGRYKIDAEDGYYNLWCIQVSGSGILEWIIDSFGQYVHGVSKPVSFENIDSAFWKNDCGATLELPDVGSFILVAKPKLSGQYMEGELPKMPEEILRCKVYELADEHAKMVFLIRQKDDQLILISGITLGWESYQFENTRKVETVGC